MNKEMISTMRVMTVVRMNDNLTDENLVKAMTINEELNTLGYTLKPEGIIMLAKSDMSNIVNDFKSIIGKVSAKPMYPNFPTQVMDMDEAEFRFHQMFHYFSTYGIEDLFGKEVQKGWLPSVEDTEKVKEDTSLLKLKVLDVIFEDEMANFCINKLSDKRERFTIEEKMIFEKAVARADKETLLSRIWLLKRNLSYF